MTREELTIEMDVLRRSARISRMERKTNEYVREIMDAQDCHQNNSTKATSYGHVERMNED